MRYKQCQAESVVTLILIFKDLMKLNIIINSVRLSLSKLLKYEIVLCLYSKMF